MIDEKKLINYIKAEINPYGKPFEGTVFEFGCKVMDYIEKMDKVGEWIPVEERLPEGCDNAVYAFCPVCGCKSEDIEYKYNDLEDAAQKVIKAWNTRKPVEDVLERLEEECVEYKNTWNKYDDEVAFGQMNGMSNAISIIKEWLTLEEEE